MDRLPLHCLILAGSPHGMGIFSPSPNVLAVMGKSLEHGHKPGTASAAGMVNWTLVCCYVQRRLRDALTCWLSAVCRQVSARSSASQVGGSPGQIYERLGMSTCVS